MKAVSLFAPSAAQHVLRFHSFTLLASMKAAIPFGNVCMNAGMRQEQKTNAILSFDGSPPDVFFHFSSGISVDVSLSRFHQTTLSLLSLVEPALTSLDLMCTVGQGEESRMHVKLICNFCEE